MTRMPQTAGPLAQQPDRIGAARIATGIAWILLLWLGLLVGRAGATQGPFIWDEDGDKLDDRIESVHALGYAFAFDGADTLAHQRIDVVRTPAGLVYSVYVMFDHSPTALDLTTLVLNGIVVSYRYEALPAVRGTSTFTHLQTVAGLPGVERVEAVPITYPLLHEAAGAIGARDPGQHAFPTWAGTGGSDGDGVVIAFLDTGINDAPEGIWPGHESLRGRCLGGAQFLTGDSLIDTPRDSSVNPADHGGVLTSSHGTHVAGIALGSGGASGYAIGIAPAAQFVDVKVLSDAGVGTGIAEALDWCIHNRARAWGGPAGSEGIDVINLSLSTSDATDGDDFASRLADRAVELGLVVVAAMGNGRLTNFVPSPAGSKRALAVGAFDHQRTAEAGDDRVASFSNTGPRASNGDGSLVDEQKPDLLAPGVAILAANGDESTDGAQYLRMSGTSMAVPMVSGAVAALRGAYPALTPDQIAELLHATARRALATAPAGTTGPDPRWLSSIGFGVLDLYAARLEMEQPGRSQVARLELAATENDVHATLSTQRELGATYFVFERAPDAGGSPGAFAPYDSVPAAGVASLASATNRALYARAWPVLQAEHGATFWYRVSYTEGGARYDTPARRLVNPVGPPSATIEVTIVHNAYDHDVAAKVTLGTDNILRSSSTGADAISPGIEFPVPASGAADSSAWADGAAATGNVAWSFTIPVAAGVADAYLPPTAEHPWLLQVVEGGYLDRSGRITRFRVVWHHPGGPDEVFDGGPLPQQTIENQTTGAQVPYSVAAVEPRASITTWGSAPNPVISGAPVVFWADRASVGDLRVYDVRGREVGRSPVASSGNRAVARWVAKDGTGTPLPPGVYFARLGRQAGYRVLVLKP